MNEWTNYQLNPYSKQSIIGSHCPYYGYILTKFLIASSMIVRKVNENRIAIRYPITAIRGYLPATIKLQVFQAKIYFQEENALKRQTWESTTLVWANRISEIKIKIHQDTIMGGAWKTSNSRRRFCTKINQKTLFRLTGGVDLAFRCNAVHTFCWWDCLPCRFWILERKPLSCLETVLASNSRKSFSEPFGTFSINFLRRPAVGGTGQMFQIQCFKVGFFRLSTKCRRWSDISASWLEGFRVAALILVAVLVAFI